jgi:dTDP-4-dehydrorhamnose 3,5-epimerase-like enzyme
MNPVAQNFEKCIELLEYNQAYYSGRSNILIRIMIGFLHNFYGLVKNETVVEKVEEPESELSIIHNGMSTVYLEDNKRVMTIHSVF